MEFLIFLIKIIKKMKKQFVVLYVNNKSKDKDYFVQNVNKVDTKNILISWIKFQLKIFVQFVNYEKKVIF